MVNARKKGIRYELELVKKYKKAGWKNAKTSRFASKMTDDLGVDIVEVEPFLPQAKNYRKNFSIGQAIELIKSIRKNFKKNHKENFPVVHVRITEKRKGVVVVDEDDFFTLLRFMNINKAKK